MTKSTWTLAELQAALDTAIGQIRRANDAIARDSGPTPMASLHVYAREARRRLPELRKVEMLLMERIKEALAAPTQLGTMEIGEGIEGGEGCQT